MEADGAAFIAAWKVCERDDDVKPSRVLSSELPAYLRVKVLPPTQES